MCAYKKAVKFSFKNQYVTDNHLGIKFKKAVKFSFKNQFVTDNHLGIKYKIA